jgi:hypothetical protein
LIQERESVILPNETNQNGLKVKVKSLLLLVQISSNVGVGNYSDNGDVVD